MMTDTTPPRHAADPDTTPDHPLTFPFQLCPIDAVTPVRPVHGGTWTLTACGWRLSGRCAPAPGDGDFFGARHLRVSYPDGYTELLVLHRVQIDAEDGDAAVALYTMLPPTWNGGAR